MIPDEISEARELVGMEGWEWVPGMQPWFPDHGVDVQLRCTFWADEDGTSRPVMDAGGDGIAPGWGWPGFRSGWLINTDDLPTRYALLGIVRRVWPGAIVVYDWLRGWAVEGPPKKIDDPPGVRTEIVVIPPAPTESLALIRAAKRALEVMGEEGV